MVVTSFSIVCRATGQDTASSSSSSGLDYKFVAVIAAPAAVVLIALIVLLVVLVRKKSRRVTAPLPARDKPTSTTFPNPTFLESDFHNNDPAPMPPRRTSLNQPFPRHDRSSYETGMPYEVTGADNYDSFIDHNSPVYTLATESQDRYQIPVFPTAISLSNRGSRRAFGNGYLDVDATESTSDAQYESVDANDPAYATLGPVAGEDRV